MSDYNDLSLRISNFDSLKKLDSDGNKKISVAEQYGTLASVPYKRVFHTYNFL